MSNAFIYRMPAGIPGDVTRHEAAIIEQHLMDANYPVTKFGLPVKLVSGKLRPMAEDDTGQPYGFLVRAYPVQVSSNESLGTATPDATKIQDVLVRGYMTVKAYNDAPTKDGQVYYRSQQTSPEVLIGRVEAGTEGSPDTNIAITNCRFMGVADDDGNVEIAFKM
jgi:hypothetical protein